MHSDQSFVSKLAPLLAALPLAVTVTATQATVYVDGTSPLVSSYPAGTFDFGTHLPNYIGATVQEGNGTALDGTRVYLYDVDDPAGVLGASAQANFNLLVWKFNAPKDSVRLYTHQDHYSGGPIGDALAPEVLEYSVWGCKSSVSGDCKAQSGWSLLSDPVSWVMSPSGPIYSFQGAAPAATIYRGGSGEFGVVNAYVQDFTLPSSYDYFAIRGSSIAMQAFTADPELDAMAAFNRVDVPIPEPETYALMLVGLGVLGGFIRRSKSITS